MVIALIFREDFKIPLNEVWRVVKEEPRTSNKIHCYLGGGGLSAFSDAERVLRQPCFGLLSL